MEVMRDTMIYFRNNPSIVLWEAGNNGVTTEHMKQMVELRKQWDPNGGRAMGCRTLNEPAATPVAEYFGVMIGQDDQKDHRSGATDLFRAYSDERRDRAPFIETEDFRDEAARRFWDDFSPPHFGFKKGPNDTYDWNSETFAVAAAGRYYDYFSHIISNTNAAYSKWAGYASIYWSDSNADGRQDSSEVCRVSGKVDSVRLPKSAYYVYRVMQNSAPDIHIIGHWNYPTNTVKTIYVAANHCDAVELFVNGKSVGKSSTPMHGYIYAFPEIKFAAGKISAVAKAKDKIVAQIQIETAGEAKKLKLTPHVSPTGLQADGSDVAFFDMEVVDAQGRRCPTDEARVDFKLEGSAIWRGGYNSGKINSVNNLWLDTECGINRVAIRSTMTAGKITVTASREGLTPATVTIESKPVEIIGGLARLAP
jgi:beta-galactosidase